MNMEIFKCHDILYIKHLEIILYKTTAKAVEKLQTVCSNSAALTMCKKFFKVRTVKNLLRVGTPEKFTTIFKKTCDFVSFRASDASPQSWFYQQFTCKFLFLKA